MGATGTRRPRLLIVGAAVLASAALVGAQARYPARVLTLTTHSSPGGGSDVFLREMAPHLSRIMGVRVVIDNVSGGSGVRAITAVARARPNGGTLYATTPTMIFSSLLSRPATTFRDLEPLVNVFYDPEVVYTAADSPFRTLADVLAAARAGRGRWGAANPASLERQTLERLKQRAGVDPAIVTYEGGGDMLLNVLNKTLDMGIGELQEIRPQLDARRVRVLGIIGDEQLPELPGVRTVREQGVDLSVRKFRGLAGPRGTPPAVIAALEAAVPRLLDDPQYRRVYSNNGLQRGFLPHAEYVRFVNEFVAETQAFLKESGAIR
ncbi:MAG: tripartite tricarboxylate transporter substrate binding protein [Vicinamibacterales bacterium]